MPAVTAIATSSSDKRGSQANRFLSRAELFMTTSIAGRGHGVHDQGRQSCCYLAPTAVSQAFKVGEVFQVGDSAAKFSDFLEFGESVNALQLFAQ